MISYSSFHSLFWRLRKYVENPVKDFIRVARHVIAKYYLQMIWGWGNYSKDGSRYLENKKAMFPHKELKIQKNGKVNTTKTEVVLEAISILFLFKYQKSIRKAVNVVRQRVLNYLWSWTRKNTWTPNWRPISLLPREADREFKKIAGGNEGTPISEIKEDCVGLFSGKSSRKNKKNGPPFPSISIGIFKTFQLESSNKPHILMNVIEILQKNYRWR